jgi:hypothetical protein
MDLSGTLSEACTITALLLLRSITSGFGKIVGTPSRCSFSTVHTFHIPYWRSKHRENHPTYARIHRTATRYLGKLHMHLLHLPVRASFYARNIHSATMILGHGLRFMTRIYGGQRKVEE